MFLLSMQKQILIESKTDLGKFYKITLNDFDAAVKCSCPGFFYRGHCSHCDDINGGLEN